MDIKDEEKPIEKVEKKVVVNKKPKFVKERYKLINEVTIKGKIKKKGQFVSLTKEGKKDFKNKNYIK